MTTKNTRLLLLLLLCASALATGCAGLHDRRDAPWDPRPGSATLMDQIPAWDTAAAMTCGGMFTVDEQRKRNLSPRC